MFVKLKNIGALRREDSPADKIPLKSHVSKHVGKTEHGHYVQVFRVNGLNAESADDEDVNNWHARLNAFWRNNASPNWAVWSTIIRRRDNSYLSGKFAPGFAADLNARYREKIVGETLMVNEIYLTIIHKPVSNKTEQAAVKFLRRASKGQDELELRDALEECDKKRQDVMAGLARYDPEPLGIYEKNGVLFSSLVEYYAFLVNGEWAPMPLPRAPLNEVIATTRPLFGSEAVEYRTATQTRLAAFLGIKEYPAETASGMLDRLLTAPFPFILTQSFSFIPKPVATKMMETQCNRLLSSGDLAPSQQAQIVDALDDLTSNRFVVGDHHFVLQVQAEPFEGVKEAEGRGRLRTLNDHISQAKYLLGDTGMVVVREDIALEGAFWSQLPGNFQYRARKAPITSRNFAALSPFHNYPSGRATGNYWGDALAMLITSALSPFWFSMHASDPSQPDGGSRKDVAHLAVFGPVGTGKSTAIGFLVCMLEKFGVTQIIFDKDEGLHILVRALGGKYRLLRHGEPSGCNPLQLDKTVPANVEFMKQWLRGLVRRGDEQLSQRNEDDLDQALHGVLNIDDVSARRLSRLIEFLDPTEAEGMFARLRKWTFKEGGDYAWVFDNPHDDIAQFMHSNRLIGYDVTAFLDNPTISEPLTFYLLYLTGQLVDGRRTVCWMDEFAKLIGRPSFAQFAKNGLETWRKLEGAFAAATQSTSHVLASTIARAVIEQCPTKIFFPNPDADFEEYKKFNITEREFNLIKVELEPGSRSFLIKQGHVSVVVKLDLKGFDFELDVISGRARNVALMKKVVAKYGSDPAVWLPKFREALLVEKAGGMFPLDGSTNGEIASTAPV